MMADSTMSGFSRGTGWGCLALFSTTALLSGCQSGSELPQPPEMAEPYNYTATFDEFTGVSLFRAERTDSHLEDGFSLRTAFTCQVPTKGGQSSSYFEFALIDDDHLDVFGPPAPFRIQYKINDNPPVDAILTAGEIDLGPKVYMVPFEQILASAVDNGAYSQGVLERTAAAAKRLMIRYEMLDGKDRDLDINLNDPAIWNVLSKCGWKIDQSKTHQLVTDEQRLSPADMQRSGQDIKLFTDNARTCRSDSGRNACARASEVVETLASTGICPVGEPGRQVWGHCPAKVRK